jgi:hypothetical protein
MLLFLARRLRALTARLNLARPIAELNPSCVKIMEPMLDSTLLWFRVWGVLL